MLVMRPGSREGCERRQVCMSRIETGRPPHISDALAAMAAVSAVLGRDAPAGVVTAYALFNTKPIYGQGGTEAKEHARVQIHLEGENVGEGEIRLDALAGFIEGLQSALRRVVRRRAGKEPATGRPAESMRQALDIRLVGFGKGSATLLVKPGAEDTWGSPAASALEELGRRVAEPGPEWDDGTREALEDARRSLGKGGRFLVHGERIDMTVDEAVTSRLQQPTLAEATAPRKQTVVGWLHMADLQPNEVTIKTALGLEWRCRFAPSLKERVLELLDEVVIAEGVGATKDRTGELTIEEIRPSLPDAYQLTIGGEDETVIDERLRALPRRREIPPPSSGPRITEQDVAELMKAIAELDE